VRDAGINPFGLKWPRFIVAADQQKRIIACGQVKPHRDKSQELASIAVQKDWRNQGIARAIIRELQQIHSRPLWLTCMDHLVPFYEPFGFEEIVDRGQMPLYYRTASRFFNLYLKLSPANGKLAVMVWH
jgi:predicted N-acetyltransferase YhbS